MRHAPRVGPARSRGTVSLERLPAQEVDPGRGRRRRSTRLSFIAVFAGILVMQIGWILVTQPFHGADEHESAFKASAVAHGFFALDPKPSPSGRSYYVRADAALVSAARPMCRWIEVEPANCERVIPAGNQMVWVTSGAARYDPAYYGLVGLASLPFHGLAQLYSMRIFTALICALLISCAASLTLRYSATRWPFIGLVVAATPEVIFSGSIVGANGVEMASAILLWVALLTAFRTTDRAQLRKLAWIAACGTVPLAVVRSFGPVWVLTIALAALVASGDGRSRIHRARASIRTAPWQLAISMLALALGTAWSLFARTNAPTQVGHGHFGSPLPHIPHLIIEWGRGVAGEFPQQQRMSPPFYAIELGMGAAFIGAALRYASRAYREAIIVVVLIALAVGVSTTLATYDLMGPAWQGKYLLPLMTGLPLLAGAALEETRPPIRDGRFLVACCICAAAAEGLAQLQVLAQWRGKPYSLPFTPWDAVIMVLVMGGCAAWWAAGALSATTP